jgi:hypothetical protein
VCYIAMVCFNLICSSVFLGNLTSVVHTRVEPGGYVPVAIATEGYIDTLLNFLCSASKFQRWEWSPARLILMSD